jgi:hypothetical protein
MAFDIKLILYESSSLVDVDDADDDDIAETNDIGEDELDDVDVFILSLLLKFTSMFWCKTFF